MQHKEGLGGSWELFSSSAWRSFQLRLEFFPCSPCALVLCVDATGATVQHCPHLRTPLQVAAAQPGPPRFCGCVHPVATAEAALGNKR